MPRKTAVTTPIIGETYITINGPTSVNVPNILKKMKMSTPDKTVPAKKPRTADPKPARKLDHIFFKVLFLSLDLFMSNPF